MVATFSPHGDAGGTLHFPSPTHMRHVDTASAFRQLRRSLSRSPSKGPAFRLVTSKSASPSPSSPLSPSGLPSPSRAASASIVSSANLGQSPLAIPYPPSARKNWSGTRKPSPMRIASRSRSSQRSPRMSTLSDLSDHGNATSRSSAGSNDDAENKVIQSTSPVEEVPAESIFKTGTTGFSEGNLLPHSALAKFERNKENIGPFAAKSSPLKRSDGIMNFDQANLESPSAKRRSLHAAAFGPDFDIFDPETIVQVRFSSNSPSDGPNSAFPSYPDNSSVISPLPRRTSSLRRTTLQQRHDKPIFARSRFAADLTHDSSTLGQGQSKGKVRTSLDGFLPSSMARDSPFSSQASLPNASTHPVSQQNTKASNLMASRHPLSRTITQSSSNSSMAEDSPTHIPHRQPEHRRAFVDFSKSLPVGAARPGSRETMILNLSSHGLSAEGSFSTPENYKLAKPLPAAFMSTGLISKRHKDIDESQTGFQGGRSLMPDTPCKRHSLAGLSSPEIVPDNAIGKTRQVRHSFGTPSTPFSPHLARPAPGTFGKGVNIFGSNFTGSSINRRASFRSIDGDDHTPSLINRIDSQGSHDFDLPPTPTKQALHVQLKNSAGRMNQHDAKKSIFGAVTVARTQSSGVDQISSPISERLEQVSPHTPRESMIPPDPSGLSISAHADGQFFKSVNDTTGSASVFPPATPTAPRDSFASFGNGRSSFNSSHNLTAAEVDLSLKLKFDKVELIGTGEFSHVYRVTKAQESSATPGYFSLSSNHGSPKTPVPDRVWAVKKSRHQYIGPKDRIRKLEEVKALKTLGQSDHTVHFFDSWEANNHLYIQTEFCEEGSLDLFLDQVGRKARLDDFRIWKIMLELSLGLKHIHDSGFIHLDLKPANVLITFEGVLKIGDFGMATQWPAQPGIEGEGDREYIGPEILKGQYDKPSDIFALGLIMLEIAGNVMLPDNGVSWQRLRSGDMSDVPSLTWSSETSTIFRDSSGKPLSQRMSVEKFYGSDSGSDEFGSPNILRGRREQRKQRELSKAELLRSGELAQPPSFMVDANHQEALDHIVRWMISPESADRPTVDQILKATGVQWAEVRRRAGATIYEGNWGPADEILAHDAEMIDV